MAELPATGSLGTGQLDTRDLVVAGVPISISSKYLYLYLALKVLTQWATMYESRQPAFLHRTHAQRFLVKLCRQVRSFLAHGLVSRKRNVCLKYPRFRLRLSLK